MTTEAQKQEIFRLRREGRSIREIARITGVSGPTVGYYAAVVELTEAQKETLRDRNPAVNPAILSHRVKQDALQTRLGYQQLGADIINQAISQRRQRTAHGHPPKT